MAFDGIPATVTATELAGTLAEAVVIFDIHNFSFRKHLTDPLRSFPTENASGDHWLKWSLKVTPLYFCGAVGGREERAHVKVQVVLESNGQQTVPASFLISIVDERGQSIYTCSPASQIKVFGPEPVSSWGYPDFISHEKLFTPKSGLLKNDALRLNARIIFMAEPGKPEINNLTRGSPIPHQQNDESLIADLSELFHSKFGADVVLISKDKKEHPAHRSILIARSRVFRATLTANHKPASTRVDVLDLDWETVDTMLEHLYTGSSIRISNLAEKLITAAEEYELKALKKSCEDHLLKMLDEDNAGHLLMVAEQAAAENLRKAAVRIVSDGIAELSRAGTVSPEEAEKLKEEAIHDLISYLGRRAMRRSGRRKTTSPLSEASITPPLTF